jgi:hypothetical protein
VSQVRIITPSWRLGPEHPDHAASGAYAYVEMRPTRRQRNTNGIGGPVMARRYSLTARGAAVKSRQDQIADASAVPTNAYPGTAAPSGSHANCPAVLGCQSGQLPRGWVREGGAS